MQLAQLVLAAVVASCLAASARATGGGLHAGADRLTEQALAAAARLPAAAQQAAIAHANSTAAAAHAHALASIENAAAAANDAHAQLFQALGPKLASFDNATAAGAKHVASAIAPGVAALRQHSLKVVGAAAPLVAAGQNLTSQANPAAAALAAPGLALLSNLTGKAAGAAQASLKQGLDAKAAALGLVAGAATQHVGASPAAVAKLTTQSSRLSSQAQAAEVQAFLHAYDGAAALLNPEIALAQNASARVYKALAPTLRAISAIVDPVKAAVQPKKDLVTSITDGPTKAYYDAQHALYGAAFDAAAPVVDALISLSTKAGAALANLTIHHAAAASDLGAAAKALGVPVKSLVAANFTKRVSQALVAGAAAINITSLDLAEVAESNEANFKRGDPVWPRPKELSNKASGTCSPFKVPGGSISVMDFCKKMRQKPDAYFKDLYEKSLPAASEPFPLSGCVFGCIVSSGWFTDLQEKFGETFGWSGKCFSEERKADGTPLRFGSTLQRDYHAPSGKNQSERAATFKGSGDFIFGGTGKFVEQGLHDRKPAWQWFDDGMSSRMQFGAGWRMQYNMFQAVGDGVTDEMRRAGPGLVLGKSYYRGPSGFLPERFRRNAATNYFMLFQACTKDGKAPWYPEYREVPLAGNP